MKKLFALLLFLVAAWSCHMDGSYYVQNCQDFVTLSEGTLMNDYGVVYSISQVASDKVTVPTVSGKRYFLYFDILNANREILLKGTTDVNVLQALPVTDPAPAYHDPIALAFSSISPYYLNLQIAYYQVKGSDFYHRFCVQYAKDEETGMLVFNFYHDGNDENPASVADAETLEQVTRILSIPITGYGWTPSGLLFNCHVLQKKADDSGYEVVQNTYSSNN